MVTIIPSGLPLVPPPPCRPPSILCPFPMLVTFLSCCRTGQVPCVPCIQCFYQIHDWQVMSETRLFIQCFCRANAFCFVFDICLVVDYKDSLWCVHSSWKLYSFIIKVLDRYWVNFCKAACGSCRFPVIIGFWWFHGCLSQVDISLSICLKKKSFGRSDSFLSSVQPAIRKHCLLSASLTVGWHEFQDYSKLFLPPVGGNSSFFPHKF